MTSVICFCYDCKWCTENGECQRGAITINEAWECDCYENYLDDYNEPFYKACLKDGEKYRKLTKFGKKIEHNGYVFYTEEKITDSGNYFLTEARTGIGVCRFCELEKRWDKFLERVADFPDVSTYPIKESEDKKMKAVLMSIQPKWCELIASGKKTVEVRKTKPKLETPFKVYIYCTKDNTFAEKTLRGFDDNGKAI